MVSRPWTEARDTGEVGADLKRDAAFACQGAVSIQAHAAKMAAVADVHRSCCPLGSCAFLRVAFVFVNLYQCDGHPHAKERQSQYAIRLKTP